MIVFIFIANCFKYNASYIAYSINALGNLLISIYINQNFPNFFSFSAKKSICFSFTTPKYSILKYILQYLFSVKIFVYSHKNLVSYSELVNERILSLSFMYLYRAGISKESVP